MLVDTQVMHGGVTLTVQTDCSASTTQIASTRADVVVITMNDVAVAVVPAGLTVQHQVLGSGKGKFSFATEREPTYEPMLITIKDADFTLAP